MKPCWITLYAWTCWTEKEFLTYISNLHAYITNMCHHRQKRHVWQLRSSDRSTTVVTTVTRFLPSTVQLSVSKSSMRVGMNSETTSCVSFSAPSAPQEVPESHLSVTGSWNLLPEVVCQDKYFLPPAHSRWAGVQSTQSLAPSCERRQRYCQSSCWR